MDQRNQSMLRSMKGFSLIEMALVLGIVALLSLIAVPSVLQWITNLQYKKTTRDIVAMMRLAKSTALSDNREQRVTLDAVNGFALQAGDKAYNAANWTPSPVTNWSKIPAGVVIDTVNVQFVPNGTADIPTPGPTVIRVRDQAGVVHYTISVELTGRISVK